MTLSSGVLYREAGRKTAETVPSAHGTGKSDMIFHNRTETGKKLARELRSLGSEPFVLAIPQGGVPVETAVAKELGCHFDVPPPIKVPPSPGSPRRATALSP